jgi:hypothetical protein
MRRAAERFGLLSRAPEEGRGVGKGEKRARSSPKFLGTT